MGVGAALVFGVLTAHVLALSATGVLPRPLLSLPGLGKSPSSHYYFKFTTRFFFNLLYLKVRLHEPKACEKK